MKLKPYILCVDDEKIILDSLETQLALDLGDLCRIEIAESGEEALEIVEEFKAEGTELAVVISDQIMPTMKGDDLLVKIHKSLPETMNILLTGQADADAVGNAVNNANLYRYISKPWEKEDMLLTVKAALNSFLQSREIIEKARRNTELQKAKQDADTARSAAESANRAKSEFLANMSHELRTPLNGILGYTQILIKEKDLSKKQVEGLEIIQKSGEHLLTLINDILDLSKIEAEKMELNFSDFSLTQLLKTMLNVFRIRSAEKNISFSHQEQSPLPDYVHGDEKKIRQILTNLLGNAIKFTDEGGVILKTGYHGNKIRFQVEDTGIGIPEESLEEIFRSFHQVAERNRSEGAGLGLAISYKLARLMKGSLGVKSALNDGSIFWFEVELPPVEGVTDLGTIDEKNIVGIKDKTPSVLIVDDKWENRKLLSNTLAPLGFQISEAADGKSAIDIALANRPEVILLDIRMPIMDGFEALHHIRALPGGKDFCIITISASAFEHDRTESLRAGSNNFISKPFQISQLLDILGDHLNLEWVYDDGVSPLPSGTNETIGKFEDPGREPGQQTAPLSQVIPPQKVLLEILDLARRGDIIVIGEYLDRLEKENRENKKNGLDFGEFVRDLRKLSRAFKIREIINYLEKLIPA